MRIKFLLTATLMVLGASGNAFAYTISGGTDVGGLDSFEAESTTLPNSGSATETAWASSSTGTTLTFAGKTEGAGFSITNEDPNVVAFELFNAPSYFLVYDGNASSESKHVLFKNESSMDWGVFNLLSYFDSSKLEEMELSHLTEFNGSSVKVPEPGTLGLLSLGVLGLITGRRKYNQSA
ncbi:putative secreted protein with PEP-CTERM sorting signal [Halospina denitrificans]|uniref:Putative secreted protein with PEP-CTERM sorting signal n=1 Tax=Halospina denitrificans TaxID=332522 RepID=A0A4R7JQY2_9GAMM|nr:PEP-CTERM sorting domain-containing protein [Halospina denitrificans]TDT40345.1 putative secreted protein with PEP-CTERM sorting signal [Halospina denitrificans]